MSIKGRSLIHLFLIAKHASCNMTGQDAIFWLGLIIGGIKWYIKPSYEENTQIHINSVNATQSTHRGKHSCVTSKRTLTMTAGTSENVLRGVRTSEER